jgi:hypothetical protein
MGLRYVKARVSTPVMDGDYYHICKACFFRFAREALVDVTGKVDELLKTELEASTGNMTNVIKSQEWEKEADR